MFQGLRSIGFYGDGFAEYPGSSLDSQEADLSVSFVTTAPDALLILAKNINGNVSRHGIAITYFKTSKQDDGINK